MFLWRSVANYPRIIPVTPSYLELCSGISFAEKGDHISTVCFWQSPLKLLQDYF